MAAVAALALFATSCTWIARVSVGTGSGVPTGGDSFMGDLSGDGSLAVFWSDATDVVSGDSNGVGDVFVRDLASDTTERVSVSTGGAQANGPSVGAAMSPDGRYVVFASDATNLVAGDTNGATDVFVRDRMSDTTERVSLGTGGAQIPEGAGADGAVDISADGRYVVFTTAGLDANSQPDVHRRDRVGDTTELVTTGSAASTGAGSLSDDGQRVAVRVDGDDVVPGDTNGVTDVVVVDLAASTTTLASRTGGGAPANGASAAPAISGDGTTVVFESAATDITGGDTNGLVDIYRFDVGPATTALVSATPRGEAANGASTAPAVSTDGSSVVYESDADDLVAGDVNQHPDVFVRQQTDDRTLLVSTTALGEGSDGPSGAGVVSGDGAVVGYDTDATNVGRLGTAPDGNGHRDVVATTARRPETHALVAGGAVQPGTTPTLTVRGRGFEPTANVNTGHRDVDVLAVSVVSRTEISVDIDIDAGAAEGWFDLRVINQSPGWTPEGLNVATSRFRVGDTAPTVDPSVPTSTDESSVEVFGTAVPGAVVEVAGAVGAPTAIADASGAWSLEVLLILGQLNQLSIQEKLGAGIRGQATTHAITQTAPAGSSRIDGNVEAEDGSPVVGAIVTVAGLATTTDTNGDFSHSDLPFGAHSVKVVASGKVPQYTTMRASDVPAGPQSVTVTDSASATTIGSGGGTATTDRDASVTIEPGALGGDTDIAISDADANGSGEMGSQGGVHIDGNGATPTPPATVDMPGGTGLDGEEVEIVRRNTETDEDDVIVGTDDGEGTIEFDAPDLDAAHYVLDPLLPGIVVGPWLETASFAATETRTLVGECDGPAERQFYLVSDPPTYLITPLFTVPRPLAPTITPVTVTVPQGQIMEVEITHDIKHEQANVIRLVHGPGYDQVPVVQIALRERKVLSGIAAVGYENMDCGDDDPDKRGVSWGDPHFGSFDQTTFDYQGAGEFTLLKIGADALEVQTRQVPVTSDLAITSAAAVGVDGQRVTYDRRFGGILRVNGATITLSIGDPVLSVGGGVTLEALPIVKEDGQPLSGTRYQVRWDTTTRAVNVDVFSGSMSVSAVVGGADVTEGLLGPSNNDPADDYTMRDGTVLDPATITPAIIHQSFGHSWRIAAADSLFDYEAGESTATFTDLAFPPSYPTTGDLSPGDLAAATAACQGAGVTEEPFLTGCILDFGFTADPDFLDSAAGANGLNLLANGGAENGDVSGWTFTGGATAAQSVSQSTTVVDPAVGDWLFWFGSPAAFDTMTQTRDVTQLVGDTLVLSGQVQTEDLPPKDTGEAELVFRDSGGAIITTHRSGALETGAAWEGFVVTAAVPAGAVEVEVRLSGTRNFGSFINVFYDDLVLAVS